MAAPTLVQSERPASDTREAAQPHLILLAAVTVALAAQGAFYGSGALAVAVLIAASAAASVGLRWPAVVRRPTTITMALAALAGWTVVTGVLDGHLTKSGATLAVIAGVTAVITVVMRASDTQRQQLVTGLIGIGSLLAASGWLGVVTRTEPWAHPDGGIWRAATSITYANAAAAVLSALAILALARLTTRPSTLDRVGAFALVVGLGATASRAGVGCFLLGLGGLAYLLGPRRVVGATARTLAGAVISLAGLLPSMPVGSSARPAWAVLALGVGLATAIAPLPHWAERDSPRAPGRRAGPVSLVVAAGAMASLALVGVVVVARHDVASLPANRVTLASPDRSRENGAALALIRNHPLTGVGPGHAVFIWSTAAHGMVFDRYAHNEYLQWAAEEGIPGVLLLLVFGVAVAQAARRARRDGRGQRSGLGDPNTRVLAAAAVAALFGLAVHSGFDFLWHVPAVALLGAILIGLACPPTAIPDDLPTPNLQEETP